MKFITLFLFLVLASGGSRAQIQEPPFWSDIQAFKAMDSMQPPPQHAILFVGSSSFTKWTDVQQYFPGYMIINRGFGGSSLPDLLRYERDVIFKYKPRQIVIYCGENDLAISDTVTAQAVFTRFKKLFSDIRTRFPGVPMIYISMKPSPSRWALRGKMIAGNELIKKYLAGKKNVVFINVWNLMLGANGEPKPDIFIDDKLHMNAKGYAIWQKEIEPHLLK